MKKREIFYKTARETIYTKDKALQNFIDSMLLKCEQMFVYKNLPEETPKRVLERMLQEGGYCIFTKENGKYVLLQGGLGGELNEYYEYTECIVANPFLKLNKTYKLNDDCVLIRNDSRMTGLLPLLMKYGVLCCDCEMSLNMLTNVLRTQYMISAGDNKTKESADIFLKKLTDGEFSCVAENAFVDSLKVHSVDSSANYIHQFIELNQYLKATAYNEIGLDANFNMKKERLTVNEVELNASALIPLADNMLEERRAALELINKKYGLEIEVDLSSVWKMQKETLDKATETQETETDADAAALATVGEEKALETEEKALKTSEEKTLETEEKTLETEKKIAVENETAAEETAEETAEKETEEKGEADKPDEKDEEKPDEKDKDEEKDEEKNKGVK